MKEISIWENDVPFRKQMRLKGYNYSQAGYYYVTICTLNRREILGHIVGGAVLGVMHMEYTPIGELVVNCLEGFNQNHETIEIDKYVVMPNHIHIILAVQGGTPRTASPTKATIPKAINAIKSLITKKSGQAIWQRGYYDHIIRDESDYLMKWNYIETNPARWLDDEYCQTI